MIGRLIRDAFPTADMRHVVWETEVLLSAAQLLADVDPGAAGPACLAIAREGAVGDEVRRSVAEQLAAIHPSV